MMTVVAIMAGLLPILWSMGAGSEVMQRIAVPMIGGMVSSTVLTLGVGTGLGEERTMMQGMMGDGSMGSMMWGLGLFGLVLLVFAVLA